MTVFLSYAHQDADRVALLRDELEQLAGQVWFDSGLTGGQVWWDEILLQLRGCDLFVLALSDSSLRSDACMSELDYTVALQRPWLAVRADATDLVRAPELVRRTQVIDFVDGDVVSVRALAKAVLGEPPPAGPLPDDLPEPPPMPRSYRDRFAEVFATSLTLDQQLALFARLRFDIETGTNREEAIDLLRTLHERPDLSWKVHEDIAAVLTAEKATPVDDSHPLRNDEPDPDRLGENITASAMTAMSTRAAEELPGPENATFVDGAEILDVLSELLAASNRLRRRVRDHKGVLGLVSAASEVTHTDVPYGFDTDAWQDIVERAVALRVALEDDSTSDAEIKNQAAELHALLRPLV